MKKINDDFVSILDLENYNKYKTLVDVHQTNQEWINDFFYSKRRHSFCSYIEGGRVISEMGHCGIGYSHWISPVIRIMKELPDKVMLFDNKGVML